jgi:hypothetical protein
MTEGQSNFEGQNINNDLNAEQKKLRIDEIRRELMHLEREMMDHRRHLHKHVDDPEVLHKIALAEERQKELLTEIQQLENEK